MLILHWTRLRLPNPDKYVKLWLESEKQTSPEARFVNQIDRLEMALQAYLYERMSYRGLGDFFLMSKM